jgi:hypothetical protein
VNIKYISNLAIIVCLQLSLASCASIGHKNISVDRFNYNEAIGNSSNEQMLLNLVRIRHFDVPVFLSVSSVLTQYVYSGSVGVNAETANSGGFNNDSVGASGRLTYIERPTISYTPLAGQEFAQQMLEPIDRRTIFALTQSGWPSEMLLVMGLERLGHLKNVTIDTSDPEDVKKLIEFIEAIQILIRLSRNNAIEVREKNISGSNNGDVLVLYFNDQASQESLLLWEEFKSKLNLDKNLNEFRIVNRITGLMPDEVVMRSRSLLDLMSHLAQGITLDNRESVLSKRIDENEILHSQLLPLTINYSDNYPSNVFVSVKYRNKWFYISQQDHVSKQAFGLLTYIYLLQAPRPPTAGPLVTVPTG